ncbi:MAG: NUDIX domain-containing protein [Bacilli bacterium]|nr:NUDIX domain-containing protein [Bacilli bacterium]MDE6141100.1 NUDIX domain-containing protein [Bacilli bacterium]
MELIDVLDENGIKTGQVLSRDEVHKNGLWHRAIVVAIVNEKNEILVQQRALDKEKNAGMWDISAAGHISSGQDSLMAAAREISEEVSVSLGYSVEVKDFRFMFSFRKEQKFSDDFIERQFYDFFILRQNGLNESNIRYQQSEVNSIKFVTITELNEMREAGLLVDREACYNALNDYLFRL